MRLLAMIVDRTTPIVSRQLVEEAQVDLAERVERGELDHGQHLLLEQDRQDHDVDRERLAEAGRDLHVVRRRVGDEDALHLERRLAGQALAELELVGEVLALLVAVGGDQPQRRLVAVLGVDQEERAVLGARPAARSPT